MARGIIIIRKRNKDVCHIVENPSVVRRHRTGQRISQQWYAMYAQTHAYRIIYECIAYYMWKDLDRTNETKIKSKRKNNKNVLLSSSLLAVWVRSRSYCRVFFPMLAMIFVSTSI